MEPVETIEASSSTPDQVVLDPNPSDTTRPLTTADVRATQLAKGGRAQDRLARKSLEYLAHETAWGAAARRRRKQMARRGLYGCAACQQWTPAAKLRIANEQHLICDECLIAAGIDVMTPAPPIEAPHDHELHQWEGEGGQ